MRFVVLSLVILSLLTVTSFADQLHVGVNLGQKQKWEGAALATGGIVLLSAHNWAIPRFVGSTVATGAKAVYGLHSPKKSSKKASKKGK